MPDVIFHFTVLRIYTPLPVKMPYEYRYLSFMIDILLIIKKSYFQRTLSEALSHCLICISNQLCFLLRYQRNKISVKLICKYILIKKYVSIYSQYHINS